MSPAWVAIPAGEATKSLSAYATLCERLTEAQTDRSACLLAIGGGVTTDLVGFVAATFLRVAGVRGCCGLVALMMALLLERRGAGGAISTLDSSSGTRADRSGGVWARSVILRLGSGAALTLARIFS